MKFEYLLGRGSAVAGGLAGVVEELAALVRQVAAGVFIKYYLFNQQSI